MGHQAANQQENKPINYTFGSTHAVGFSETPFYVIFMREKWWNGGKDLYHLSVFIWVEMVGGVGKREKGHLKDCFRWNPFPSSFAALCRKTYEKKNCFMAFLSSLHLFFFSVFVFDFTFSVRINIYFKLQHSSNPPCVQYLLMSTLRIQFRSHHEKKNRFFLDNWTAPSSAAEIVELSIFLSRFSRSWVARLSFSDK